MLSDFLNHMKISLLLKKKCLTYIAKQQVKAKINKILKWKMRYKNQMAQVFNLWDAQSEGFWGS